MKKYKIGIIGSGMIGGTVAQLLAKAGYELFIGTRDPQKEQALLAKLGKNAQVGSVVDAAKWGDVIFESVPLFAIPEISKQIASYVKGKVLLDTANPYAARDGAAADEVERLGQGSGVWVAQHYPGAHVVKAFNTVYFETLGKKAHSNPPIGIPIASDDASALKVASSLVQDAGFEPVVIGKLARAKDFGPGTPAYNNAFAPDELKRLLNV